MQSRPYHIHRGLFFIITQPQQTTNQTKLSDRFASGDRFASAASFFVCGDVMMRAWASARPCMAYCSAAEQKKKQHRLRRGAPPPTGRVEICCFGRRMHADACARAQELWSDNPKLTRGRSGLSATRSRARTLTVLCVLRAKSPHFHIPR